RTTRRSGRTVTRPSGTSCTACSTPAPASEPDTQEPTWADERAAVFDAICALRQLCEALSEQLVELQKRPWGVAYHAMAKWGDAECARIENESLQQQREEEPLDLPPLHTLRQAQ